MPDLKGLKEYAVIDGDASDTLLQLCLDAAIGWFENAGVKKPEQSTPLYTLGVYRLATFYYDNRGPVDGSSGADSVPYGIQGIVHQLRLSGGVG